MERDLKMPEGKSRTRTVPLSPVGGNDVSRVMVLSDIRVKMLDMEQLFPKMGELADVKVSSI